MNTTGIVRKVDQLGRIVVPRETRQSLCIEVGDSIEFFYDTETIYMKKYTRGCIFCDSMEDLIRFKDLFICEECVKQLCGETDEILNESEKMELLAGSV